MPPPPATTSVLRSGVILDAANASATSSQGGSGGGMGISNWVARSILGVKARRPGTFPVSGNNSGTNSPKSPYGGGPFVSVPIPTPTPTHHGQQQQQQSAVGGGGGGSGSAHPVTVPITSTSTTTMANMNTTTQSTNNNSNHNHGGGTATTASLGPSSYQSDYAAILSTAPPPVPPRVYPSLRDVSDWSCPGSRIDTPNGASSSAAVDPWDVGMAMEAALKVDGLDVGSIAAPGATAVTTANGSSTMSPATAAAVTSLHQGNGREPLMPDPFGSLIMDMGGNNGGGNGNGGNASTTEAVPLPRSRLVIQTPPTSTTTATAIDATSPIGPSQGHTPLLLKEKNTSNNSTGAGGGGEGRGLQFAQQVAQLFVDRRRKSREVRGKLLSGGGGGGEFGGNSSIGGGGGGEDFNDEEDEEERGGGNGRTRSPSPSRKSWLVNKLRGGSGSGNDMSGPATAKTTTTTTSTIERDDSFGVRGQRAKKSTTTTTNISSRFRRFADDDATYSSSF